MLGVGPVGARGGEPGLQETVRPVLLSGYYGFGNAGDEGILEMMVTALLSHAPDVPLRVLTATPQETARSLAARRLLSPAAAQAAVAPRHPLAALGEVARAGMLVSGGGGLLQERTSRKSLLYYVGLLLWARLLGVPRVIFAQGVGPLWRRSSLWLTRLALRGASIWVRDEPSRRLLEHLGLTGIHVTADPVFAASPPREGKDRGEEPGALAVVLRPSGAVDGFDHDLALLRAIADEARVRQIPVRLVPLQPPRERDWAERLAHGVPGVQVAEIPRDSDGLQGWLGLFRSFRAVVSARYHGLVFGALTGKPLLALAVDPKLSFLARELGLDQGWLEPPFQASQVGPAVARLLDEGRPPATQVVEGLRVRAQEGLTALAQHVKSLVVDEARLGQLPSWQLRRFRVLDTPVDPVSLEEAVDLIAQWCEASGPGRQVITSNPELVMHAQAPESEELRAVLERADLVVADGVGLVWAARFLGYALPGRVAGADLADRLCREAARREWRLFLWGGRPGVAEEAARKLQSRWPGLQVVGTEHGYLKGPEEVEALERLRQARPDLLLVGMGAPRQELWIDRLRGGGGRGSGMQDQEAAVGGAAPARVMMGVGGVLDVWAGRKRRAPRWVQALGLEWAYRVIREPARFSRLAALPRFVAAVVAERLGMRGNGV